MISILLKNVSFLSLLVVAPLLFWGIWIASVESFDELNSMNSIPKRMESGGRSTRRALLPLYLLAFSFCVVVIAAVLVTEGAYLIPVLALSTLTVAFLPLLNEIK